MCYPPATASASLVPTSAYPSRSPSSPGRLRPMAPPVAPVATSRIPPAAAVPLRRRVAVIGAGAAGLVAARELRREGHGVVVFERGESVGGTWVYTQRIEKDPLGIDPAREVVHSSLYGSLRTNLPRETMGFQDYPFSAASGAQGGHENEDEVVDSRRFPGHPEVLRYLRSFAREFDLEGVVRFRTEVVAVEPEGGGQWSVRSRRTDGDGQETTDEREVYDGVVVCNGHYTEPRRADIPGVDTWPGKQMHSHNYRVPESFLDQVVVLIGSSASAVDICRDISRSAREVHVASRSDPGETPRKLPGYDNIWLHPMIERANEDGTVNFKDGSSVLADVILHCTGYRYHFPFLKTGGAVNVDDNCVGPLYKHVFPPSLAPGLSFIGIPWKVVPFFMFQYQSRWVAAVLSGRADLPTEEDMMSDIDAFYKEVKALGFPKRYTHNLGGQRQFEYDNWLAERCGYPPVEEWRRSMYEYTGKNRVARPETYRDEWDDDHLVLQAHNDFAELYCTPTSLRG